MLVDTCLPPLTVSPQQNTRNTGRPQGLPHRQGALLAGIPHVRAVGAGPFPAHPCRLTRRVAPGKSPLVRAVGASRFPFNPCAVACRVAPGIGRVVVWWAKPTCTHSIYLIPALLLCINTDTVHHPTLTPRSALTYTNAFHTGGFRPLGCGREKGVAGGLGGVAAGKWSRWWYGGRCCGCL